MPVDGVLAEDQRRRDLSVREAGRDEAQHLRLAPVRGESPFDSTGDTSSRNPASARCTSRWSSSAAGASRRSAPRTERSGAGMRARGHDRSATAGRPADGARAPASSTRGRNGRASPYSSSSRNAAASIGVGGAALVMRLERRDLVTTRVRDDEAREHLRGERPVGRTNSTIEPTRRVGEVLAARRSRRRTRSCGRARGAALARPRRREAGARAGEDVAGSAPRCLDYRPEGTGVDSIVGGPGSMRSESPAPIRS